jgi:8-oxo-dGTP pyrophosphatase MutT (NUDIX family)
MLSIFFQDRIIKIPLKESELKHCNNIVNVIKREEIEKAFLDFINSTKNEICFNSKNLKLLPDLFCSAFKVIEAAGGIVKNKEGKYLFIFRNGYWDLPKGKLEKGEDIKSCAIREVEEECKISGLKIVNDLSTTYHIYELHKNKWALKITYWYEMFTNETKDPVPQVEEGILEAVWLSRNEIDKVLNNTYPSIFQVINEAIKK